MKDTIECLRQKLKWYMHDATYVEYNEQEVNYIIEQLKVYDAEREKEIESSCITFSLDKLWKKNETNKKTHNRTVITLFLAAIASSIFIMMLHRNELVAGLKIGIFNFINKENTGIQMITVPTYTTDTLKYYSLEDLPKKVLDFMWQPREVLTEYTLTYIESDSDIIIERYDNSKNADYVEIWYLLDSNSIERNENVTMQMKYKDIEIIYYNISLTDSQDIYGRSFYYSGNAYYIEGSNINDVNLAIYEFIDYVLEK